MKRADDYATRRAHLADLTDKQLEDYFWKLTGDLVDPLIKLGYENTTPSIERSVLLRMGFSSLEAKPLVNSAIEHNLIGFGVGNVIYRLAKHLNKNVREAGLELLTGKYWQVAEELFKEDK
ncbi:MAG: ornithine aminomutase subunit alpha [Clostridia bacterium]